MLSGKTGCRFAPKHPRLDHLIINSDVFNPQQCVYAVEKIEFEKAMHLCKISIVLDPYNRVVSINPTALKIVEKSENEIIGQPIHEILPQWHDIKLTNDNIQVEHQISTANAAVVEQHYALQINPILNRKQNSLGRILTLRDITQHILYEKEILLLAHTDPLTGILNRRAFFDAMRNAIYDAHEAQMPLSFILFDIDDFKQVNDQYGHQIGDQVLFQIAQICQNNLREIDYLGRYGGDEFCIFLPETELPQATEVANQLREVVENFQISPSQTTSMVSLSIGIATYNGMHDITIEDILNNADKALYAAKDKGKNQVVGVNLSQNESR